MRRAIALLAVLGAVAVGPLTARADDIRDGADCNSSDSSFVDNDPTNAIYNQQDADRGAYCVRGGGMTIFYIGGEAQPEDSGSQGFQGLCGSLTIMDMTFGSGHADANPSDDSDWDWNHTHPGPDGQLGTDDDVIHHHHCD